MTMGKRFKRYAAIGMIVLLVICAVAAQAEKAVSGPGGPEAPVIYIPAPKAGGFVWHGGSGDDRKVKVTSIIGDQKGLERFAYSVTSNDEKIKYCVPSVKAGSISVSESKKAAMKMVGSGDAQECRIYFDKDFEFVYEPRFEKGAKVFEDEICLDFYGENGQWICKKAKSLFIGMNIPAYEYDAG